MTPSRASTAARLGPIPSIPAIWWVLVGATVGIGIVGILSIGVFFLLVGAVLASVGLSSKRLRTPAIAMAVAGLAIGPLMIAWLNREGPGMICETSGPGTSCAERWSPWPFLVVGAMLVVAGVALTVVVARSRRSGTPPPLTA